MRINIFKTPLEILEYKDKYLDDTARIRALPWSAMYKTESGVTAMEEIELKRAFVARNWSISKHEQAASRQLQGDSRPATIEI